MGGLIEIELTQKKDDKYQLVINDNGIGIPDNIDMYNPQTLGLKIVAALAHQIEGTIEIDSTRGLKYTVHFKI